MIAQFIVDRLNVDAIDDGTIATLETNFIAAVRSTFSIPPTGVTAGTYGPTMSLAVQADGRITALSNTGLTPTGISAGQYLAPTMTVAADGRITAIATQPYVKLSDFGLTDTGDDGTTWMKLPNGFIIQSWHGVSNGASFFNFPVAFPTACFHVSCLESNPVGWLLGGVGTPGTISPTIFGTTQISRTQFALYCLRLDVTNSLGFGTNAWFMAPGIGSRFFAIGK